MVIEDMVQDKEPGVGGKNMEYHKAGWYIAKAAPTCLSWQIK